MAIPNSLTMADLEPVGPGTPAGRYLRTFWGPVYRAQDLPRGRAKPLEMFSEKFTLYRGADGTAHVVSYRCPHRGVPLFVGWVEGDDLRCRYHGWKYSSDGQCIEQPNEDRPFCERVKMKTYPTREAYGLIWAYLGDGEAPAFRRFVDLEQPGVTIVDPPEILPCSFWNKMDNDPAHVPWVHRNSLIRMGRGTNLRVQEEVFEEAPFGFVGTTREGKSPHRFIMPNIRQWWARSRAPGYEGRDLGETKMVFTVAINDQTFCSFDVSHTPLTGEEGERYAAVRQEVQGKEAEDRWAYGKKVLAGEITIEDLPEGMTGYTSFEIEDYVTQVGQGKLAGRGPEQLCQHDRKIILIRRLWTQEVAALLRGSTLTQWQLPTEPYAAEPRRLDAMT
jgi:5,5'-dehydrodivanillate O-demethylase